MFAATQHFLTNAFVFVAVASLVGLVLELAYFLASTPDPQPTPPTCEATDTGGDITPVSVAPVIATALSPTVLNTLGVVKLRAVALARGRKGAGRWKKSKLLEVLLS